MLQEFLQKRSMLSILLSFSTQTQNFNEIQIDPNFEVSTTNKKHVNQTHRNSDMFCNKTKCLSNPPKLKFFEQNKITLV